MEQVKKIDAELTSEAVDSEIKRKAYIAPKFFEMGDVQSITHGSREQTSDSGSGYQGG